MYVLLSGVIATLALLAATAFLRSYARTHDRFFALFAAAFALLGLAQLELGIFNTPESNRPLAYIPRLVVFLLILVAIFDKNRTTSVKSKEAGVVAEFPTQRRHRAAR